VLDSTGVSESGTRKTVSQETKGFAHDIASAKSRTSGAVTLGQFVGRERLRRNFGWWL